MIVYISKFFFSIFLWMTCAFNSIILKIHRPIKSFLKIASFRSTELKKRTLYTNLLNPREEYFIALYTLQCTVYMYVNHLYKFTLNMHMVVWLTYLLFFIVVMLITCKPKTIRDHLHVSHIFWVFHLLPSFFFFFWCVHPPPPRPPPASVFVFLKLIKWKTSLK